MFLIRQSSHTPKAVASNNTQATSGATGQTEGTVKAPSPTAPDQKGVSDGSTPTQATSTAQPNATSTTPDAGPSLNPLNTWNPPLGPSGIKGYVYEAQTGNQCPNGHPGVVCDIPLQRTVKVLDSQGSVIATLQSDANGYFEATLDPGPYIVVPQACDPGVCQQPQTQSITVQKVGYTGLTLYYYPMMSTN